MLMSKCAVFAYVLYIRSHLFRFVAMLGPNLTLVCSSAINRVALGMPNVIATGDDEGIVKVSLLHLSLVVISSL